MGSRQFYKNFNMVVELDVAGEFIYNGIQEFYQTSCFENDAKTFTALYNIAVGLERLQKIVLVLWKFDDYMSNTEFETLLKDWGHNHIHLRDEIKTIIDLTEYKRLVAFNGRENEFIELISRFYDLYRYGRFIVNSGTAGEVELLTSYIKKYTNTEVSAFSGSIIVSDDVKKLLGRVISKISNNYYQLIREGSIKNQIFTYELRYNSKAEKVFRSESMYREMFDERIALKELLIYLRNSKETHPIIKYIEEIEPLELDPEFINLFVGEIEKGVVPQELVDEVSYLYDETISNCKERLELVDLLGNNNVDFEYHIIFKCVQIVKEIIENKIITCEQIGVFCKEKKYVIDDSVLDFLDAIEHQMYMYNKGETDIETLVSLFEGLKLEYQDIFYLYTENDEIC